MPDEKESALNAAKVRPVLQAIARLISTDRRIAILATGKAEILLSNPPANQLGLDVAALKATFSWPTLCARAQRSGSVAVSTTYKATQLEGELVHLSLGNAETFLLRLVETDQEAVQLQNRARAATLLRVAHDLRTPIQSVLASAETLFEQEKGAAAAPNPRTADVQKSAQLALTHIEKVIRVIRGELTSADLQADEDFDLGEEARTIVDMIKPIVHGRGASVTLTVEPQDQLRLHGPVHLVRALLQNMFDNSGKHGGEAIDIHVTCAPGPKQQDSKKQSENIITVQVADQGGGIPDAQKARLLGSNIDGTRIDRSTDAKTERTSAGMSVLAHAISHLGGHLELLDRAHDGEPLIDTTQPVAGTILRATFSLPGAAADTAAEDLDATPSSDGLLKGLGILVVEDSPSSRDWLVHSLSQAGAQVEGVENGLRAMRILQRPDAAQNINLLLTDMTLPHINGVELLRGIRDEQSKGRLEWDGLILGLTAHVNDKLREACLALGMVRLLEKPIRNAALCHAVYCAAHSKDDNTTAATDGSAQPTKKTPATLAEPFSARTVKDLTKQLGQEAAVGFMMRAHAEAQAILDEITPGKQSAETKRLLHAATGSSGLTGLKLLEHGLRQVELSLDTSETTQQVALEGAREALDATQKAIHTLGSSSPDNR
ncbi:hybrid sensor histidine kinase/response regulator [Sulfitobacter dubius]|uniref:Sensor protein EvgS n=1 Tax=Sulfitobacter dubius TaxID=218673 RepID=A0ABY3ZR46_9RHOB|nr:hybrid sensor histidine kinase/response regulator [Sulfitobacter dubius]UOA16620.1 Sensor protein EvgS [Sulfitobacter dubius]